MTLTDQEIIELIEQYERDARAIKEEALKMVWYMRGGLGYEEAMLLSLQEKEIIAKLIKENMETTKESGLPFF